MRYYLDVPRSDNEKVKRNGACWHGMRRQWYVEDPKDMTPFLRYLSSNPVRDRKRTKLLSKLARKDLVQAVVDATSRDGSERATPPQTPGEQERGAEINPPHGHSISCPLDASHSALVKLLKSFTQTPRTGTLWQIRHLLNMREFRTDRDVIRALVQINAADIKHGRPLLNAVVVCNAGGMPRKGFLELLMKLRSSTGVETPELQWELYNRELEALQKFYAPRPLRVRVRSQPANGAPETA